MKDFGVEASTSGEICGADKKPEETDEDSDSDKDVSMNKCVDQKELEESPFSIIKISMAIFLICN
jgi:hypothetical protein